MEQRTGHGCTQQTRQRRLTRGSLGHPCSQADRAQENASANCSTFSGSKTSISYNFNVQILSEVLCVNVFPFPSSCSTEDFTQGSLVVAQKKSQCFWRTQGFLVNHLKKTGGTNRFQVTYLWNRRFTTSFHSQLLLRWVFHIDEFLPDSHFHKTATLPTKRWVLVPESSLCKLHINKYDACSKQLSFLGTLMTDLLS